LTSIYTLLQNQARRLLLAVTSRRWLAMAMGNLPPFEDKDAYGGFFPALLQTWVGACFRPTEFFESVGNSQDLTPALLFGVLVGWIYFVIEAAGSLIFRAHILMMRDILMLRQEKIAGLLAGEVFYLVCAGLFGWLLALLIIFISGVIVHLFLMLFGGANQGLTMTLRVISYAYAPQIFAVVPFVGWLIASIWMLVLAIIGLAVAHGTDTWRAALAVLVPNILCVCVVGVLYGAVIVAILTGVHRP
jgi:hypothetical protein